MENQTENLLNIVKKFKDKKILVIGDLMLDEYFWGNVNRISPEAPIPILDVNDITYVMGGAANVAHNAKSLGTQVSLAGVIGSEERGKMLKGILEKKGIETKGIFIDEKRKTTLKTRVIAKNKQLIRIDQEDLYPISQELENKILHFVNGKIKGFNAVIISDYAKGVLTPSLTQEIIKAAKENNILCLVDPKGDDYSKYKGCNIITPNKKELAQALNVSIDQIKNDNKFIQEGKTLLSQMMCDNVLVTQGGKGMTLFEKNGETFHCPAFNKKAIDVSGAGDTSIVTFGLALITGANLKQAAIIASHTCAIVVSKVGTAVVYPEELQRNLRNVSAYEK